MRKILALFGVWASLACAACGAAGESQSGSDSEDDLGRETSALYSVGVSQTPYRCNAVACVCSGARACLELIDSGKCKDFYCSAGPECACNI